MSIGGNQGVVFPPQRKQRTEGGGGGAQSTGMVEDQIQLIKFYGGTGGAQVVTTVKTVWTPFAVPSVKGNKSVVVEDDATPTPATSTTAGGGSGGGTEPSPDFVSNMERFPGYHMFVPRPRVIQEELPVAVEDGGKGYEQDPCFLVYDSSASENMACTEAPIHQIKHAATGCKVHGPFKCSCQFLQVMSSHLMALHSEFSDHEDLTSGQASVMVGRKRGGAQQHREYEDYGEEGEGMDDAYGQPMDYDGAPQTNSGPPKVIEVVQQFIEDLSTLTADDANCVGGARWGQSGGTPHSSDPKVQMRSAMFSYLRSEACNSGSVIVSCPELKYYCAIIASPDLPIDVHRRVIGPFPLQPVDKLESMEKAVQSAISVKPTFPECVECRYKGTKLGRCFVCTKYLCTTCAMSCDSCNRKKSFCPHCIIVKRVLADGAQSKSRDAPVPEKIPDIHLCTRCI